jgi:hypothetical protein
VTKLRWKCEDVATVIRLVPPLRLYLMSICRSSLPEGVQIYVAL